MTGGRDEVQAGVDARVVVAVHGALNLELLLEEVLKLFVDVFHDGLVTVGSTHKQTKLLSRH